jgi:hypothetical protein
MISKYIYEAFNNGRTIIAVFLDFSKAFDVHNELLNIMPRFGIFKECLK